MSDSTLFRLVHDEARQRAAAAVARAPDGYVVTIKPPTRNSEINAALHAMLTEIAQRVTWAGRKWDVTTWKRLCTAAWLRATDTRATVLPAIDGAGVDVIYEPTSQMSQAQVRDLLAYIEAWAAEQPEMQGVEA